MSTFVNAAVKCMTHELTEIPVVFLCNAHAIWFTDNTSELLQLCNCCINLIEIKLKLFNIHFIQFVFLYDFGLIGRYNFFSANTLRAYFMPLTKDTITKSRL